MQLHRQPDSVHVERMLRHLKSAFVASVSAVANGPAPSVFVALVSFLGGPATIAYKNRTSGRAMTVALSEWWSAASLGISYMVVAGTILFVWNLLRAPYKEQRQRADALQARLDKLENSVVGSSSTADVALRDEVEVFARTHFDRPFALLMHAAIAANAQTDWSAYPEGKISRDEEFKLELARPPSTLIARAYTAVEAQERLVSALTKYEETASSMHLTQLPHPAISQLAEYQPWRTADAAFLPELKRFVLGPRLTVLHQEIPQSWGERQRAQWDTLSQSVMW